jgi:hypothetical protein
LALAIASAPILGLMFGVAVQPHYLAPAFGAIALIAGLGMQTLDRWNYKGAHLGALSTVVLLGASLGYLPIEIMRDIWGARHPASAVGARPLVIQRLQALPGPHLVIVRYSGEHSFHDEWVYNRADIDRSTIVWAQDMGAAKNRELLDYFRDRKVWLIQPDLDPLGVTPYSGDAIDQEKSSPPIRRSSQ